MIDLAARPLPAPVLPFLPKPLLEPRRPLVAIGVGALAAFVPTVMLGALAVWLFPTGERPQFEMAGRCPFGWSSRASVEL